MRRTPTCPASRFSQNVFPPSPIGETTPTPVITTRRMESAIVDPAIQKKTPPPILDPLPPGGPALRPARQRVHGRPNCPTSRLASACPPCYIRSASGRVLIVAFAKDGETWLRISRLPPKTLSAFLPALLSALPPTHWPPRWATTRPRSTRRLLTRSSSRPTSRT